MAPTPRHLLVTYALTYANGPLHLGHLTGFIQTDIWVRFQKMRGNHCLFVSGADSHGTPIMIQAEKSGLDPAALTESMRSAQQTDLAAFQIDLDNYHTTHSPENQALTESVFLAHQQAGNILQRTIHQAFDPEKNMFLSDRLIRGNCPRCQAADQYGDSCEHCGATYTPMELGNPRSSLSGAIPIEKESLHYFFRLTHFEKFLQQWTTDNHLQRQISHKLAEWFAAGLKEWDISRDTPYFGFLIPGETQKYFYCWLDAPIGYMASVKNFCNRHPDHDFDFYWQKNSPAELYHFIGKDIIYFHALFWPALLFGAGYRTPTAIFTHGFLTVNGQKMSKSRGNFVSATKFRSHFNPEYLRYYLATRLSHHVEDLDFSPAEFQQCIHADVVGKFVNIASRSARLLQKHFSNILSDSLHQPELFDTVAGAAEKIAQLFETCDLAEAMREIMRLTGLVNQYIDAQKPWVLARDPQRQAETHAICSMGIQLFRQLMVYLKPVLPGIAKAAEHFLKIPALHWKDSQIPLPARHVIETFVPLAERIPADQISLFNNDKS